MTYLRATGSYLPTRIVTNDELATAIAEPADWILRSTGIRERRYAADDQTVTDLAVLAAQACLTNANLAATDLGMVLVASGSPDRYCPGPASQVAARLGLTSTPALDIPVASAGSLIALAMAMAFAPTVGRVLVVGAEVMSRRIQRTPDGRNTAILFGDGAGALLVDPSVGFLRLADAALFTDGTAAEILTVDTAGIHMDGGSVILRASRKLPAAITDLLDRNQLAAADIGTVLMHQANLNLIHKIAGVLAIPTDRCFTNIDRYGNTSAASLPIATAEWHLHNPAPSAPVVLAAFGTGINYGAILALPNQPQASPTS